MFLDILKGIARGKSLLRTLMNLELRKFALQGKVLDVGGGTNPSYFGFFGKKEGVEVTNIDGKYRDESGNAIDFEKDKLPYDESVFDQVILCNVLEHIYNYKFLVLEIRRILKGGGKVIGFVPFLINYHPDPRDYFRYTKESLQNIFTEIGFSNVEIKEVGFGPFSVAFNTIAGLPFPRLCKVLCLPFFYFSDSLILKFRPWLKTRYPLGYLFTLKK